MSNWLSNNALKLGFGVAITVAAMTSAWAQNAEPSYKADPDVYKVIFENSDFRVIEATRKKGVHDKEHSHLAPSIVYWLVDCTDKLYTPDGKTTESVSTAGMVRAIPITPSHSAENIGAADCEQIIVEKK